MRVLSACCQSDSLSLIIYYISCYMYIDTKLLLFQNNYISTDNTPEQSILTIIGKSFVRKTAFSA